MKSSFLFFFFSSRRRHTRSLRDWSSDVCSSDLRVVERGLHLLPRRRGERLVIVERDEVEDERGRVRVARAEQRLRATCALLEVEPDDGGLVPLRHLLRHLLARPCGHADRGGRRGADLHEVTPREPRGLRDCGRERHPTPPRAGEEWPAPWPYHRAAPGPDVLDHDQPT